MSRSDHYGERIRMSRFCDDIRLSLENNIDSGKISNGMESEQNTNYGMKMNKNKIKVVSGM